jgi:hypothetical protein
VDFTSLLSRIEGLHDLTTLVGALRHAPQWTTLDSDVTVVGQQGDFPWLALEASEPERKARALARRWSLRGRPAGVMALDPAGRRLTVAIAFGDLPAMTIDLDRPAPVALHGLTRLVGTEPSALAYALRAAEALAGEAVGRRFFREFRATLERMSAGIPGACHAEDRQAFALLQLTRVLFLYFVQAKGWLGGRERFLAEEIDRCLARRRRIHRDLLRPLFFGTLNRPPAQRSRGACAFGAIPFLNGGLFEPHPLDRRVRVGLPNELWREAFDGLFERFHFTVAEGEPDGRIAPDMLGRVFEGVMAPDSRRASGTYYTPAALVHRVITAALAGLIARRTQQSLGASERLLQERHPLAGRALAGISVLDPAVGSGAFLLGALESLAALDPSGDSSAARRTVLQRNLFGVDKSAGAVRLAELRLWLAVIANDPADRPDLVHPLPNLDCLIRQGDSLFDPFSAGIGVPAELAAPLAEARARVVVATGADKRVCLRRLAELELRATSAALDAAEGQRAHAVSECLQEARSRDLFGGTRGLSRQLRDRLAERRRELHAVRRARRVLAREHEVPWFHYHGHFADVFARGGFDLVVGNPPWLRAEQIPLQERRRLAGRYRWWTPRSRGYANRADLAVAFLERALELTRPEGITALVLPAKLATAGYGAAARHALASTTTLLHVADLSESPDAVFEATVYPLALVACKARPQRSHRVATRLEPGERPCVRQERLRGGGPWVLAREPLRDALRSLQRDHPRMDSVLACQLGLKTGADAIFLDPPAELETELLRSAVRGRDVRPFRVAPRRRLLYTHGIDGRPLEWLPQRAEAYLAMHRHRLVGRADYKRGPPWTLFRTGPATAAHRVVWADLARRLTAAALVGRHDAHLVPLNTCYVAPAHSALEARRLAAWLNATWLGACARASAVPAANDYARFTAALVGGLPLPATVLTCRILPELEAAGRRGERVQDDLDELTARHLALAPRARSALRHLLAGRAGDRG